VLTVDHLLMVLATAAVLILCVVLHFEGLRLLSDRLPTPHHHRRRRIVYVIMSVLCLHMIEIWFFGLAYYGLLQSDRFGTLEGMDVITVLDCVYYSAVVFSTLGFGDMVPKGHIRFLTGTEGVAGLTFITWSASYTYLAMTRTWTEGGRG